MTLSLGSSHIHTDKSTHTLYADPPISNVVESEIICSDQNPNLSALIVVLNICNLFEFT